MRRGGLNLSSARYPTWWYDSLRGRAWWINTRPNRYVARATCLLATFVVTSAISSAKYAASFAAARYTPREGKKKEEGRGNRREHNPLSALFLLLLGGISAVTNLIAATLRKTFVHDRDETQSAVETCYIRTRIVKCKGKKKSLYVDFSFNQNKTRRRLLHIYLIILLIDRYRFLSLSPALTSLLTLTYGCKWSMINAGWLKKKWEFFSISKIIRHT